MQMRKIKYLSFFYGKAEFLIIITFIVITHILAYTYDLKLFLGEGVLCIYFVLYYIKSNY